MLSATILHGVYYRVTKHVMPDPLGPLAFVMLRILGSGLLFWILHLTWVKEKVTKAELGRLFLCGLFGSGINMLLLFQGLSWSSPINASLVMVTVPILILLISYVMRMETLTGTKIAGITLGCVGSLFLVLLGDGADVSFTSLSLWGDLMIFVNGASYAMFLILARPLIQKHHPVTVLKWIFLFGGICCLPVSWAELSVVPFEKIESSQWLSICFVVLGATALAYLLNISALRYVQASTLGYYVYVQPILAISIDVMLGYATLSIIKGLAALLIFGGVYLVIRSKK